MPQHIPRRAIRRRAFLAGGLAVPLLGSGAAHASARAADRASASSASALAAGPGGFASVNALGRNGTTGGLGGPTVVATDAEQFLEYIDSIGPLVIRVAGTIAITSKQGVRPNKTIIGVGTSGHITGGGLDFYRSYNVIVRNIRFTAAEDDAVNVGQESHHIWIDHNTFSGAVDGSIDVVRGADYVTVSWNHFDHTDKTMLIGHSDGAASTDTGRLKVTIHHNFFDNSRQRHPASASASRCTSTTTTSSATPCTGWPPRSTRARWWRATTSGTSRTRSTPRAGTPTAGRAGRSSAATSTSTAGRPRRPARWPSRARTTPTPSTPPPASRRRSRRARASARSGKPSDRPPAGATACGPEPRARTRPPVTPGAACDK
ncbi:pectate lyase family protein [Thermocatellispora tengchongensis]|uniref:pectate lyase family protein n=1 Tax=Thermocatellispora tengchongensis TaxID=1073253 RepID=UPI0036259B47